MKSFTFSPQLPCRAGDIEALPTDLSEASRIQNSSKELLRSSHDSICFGVTFH